MTQCLLISWCHWGSGYRSDREPPFLQKLFVRCLSCDVNTRWLYARLHYAC